MKITTSGARSAFKRRKSEQTTRLEHAAIVEHAWSLFAAQTDRPAHGGMETGSVTTGPDEGKGVPKVCLYSPMIRTEPMKITTAFRARILRGNGVGHGHRRASKRRQ